MRIKYYPKMMLWVFILLCIFLLKNYENQFQRVQKLLILESNNLFSPHSVQPTEDMNAAWGQLAKTEEQFWVFATIEESSQRKIVAFYATDYKQIVLPLQAGKLFTEPDSGEAIVGAGVPTQKLNGGEYFDYADTRYNVIAKLGMTKESPLKNTVLLNDSTLLEQTHIPFVFDAPHPKNLNWLKGYSLENKGIERWFNITFITSWIRYMTWLIILCASVLAMHYYLIIAEESRIIHAVVGADLKTIFIKELLYISTVTFLIILLNACTISSKMPFSKFIIPNMAIYAVLLISFSIMFWWQMLKGARYYA